MRLLGLLNKLRWPKWEPGRQKSGYEKMQLASSQWPIPHDLYLLHFPEGSSIPPHTDPVESLRHYRLNIVLKKATQGGEFICKDPILATSRFKFFRPDISEHGVTPVKEGSRLLLSLGWRY